MGIQLNFNAATVEPNAPRELYQPGKYPAMMVGAEMKPTKNGDGQMLVLQFQFIDGPYAGKKITDRLNLANPNPQTVEIAYRTLSAICRSVNVLRDDLNTDMLQGIPLVLTVKIKPGGTRDGKEYEPNNEVDGYEPISALNGASAAPGAGGPPWSPGVQQAGPPAPAFAPPQQHYAQPQAAPQPAPVAAWQPPTAAQPWQQPAPAAPQTQAYPQQQQPAPGAPWAPPAPAQAAPQQHAPQQSAPAPAGAPPPPWQR